MKEARHFTGYVVYDTTCVKVKSTARISNGRKVKIAVTMPRASGLEQEGVFWCPGNGHVRCSSEKKYLRKFCLRWEIFPPASVKVESGFRNDWGAWRPAVKMREGWDDRLAYFPILLRLCHWPVQRKLWICYSKREPKKKILQACPCELSIVSDLQGCGSDHPGAISDRRDSLNGVAHKK